MDRGRDGIHQGGGIQLLTFPQWWIPPLNDVGPRGIPTVDGGEEGLNGIRG